KHPFDQWSKSDFDAFKNFFGRVQLFPAANRDKDTQEAYQQIVKELGLEKTALKGNQLQNEFGKLLRQGKTVPFPEIALLKPQPPRDVRNGGNEKALARNQAATAISARV